MKADEIKLGMQVIVADDMPGVVTRLLINGLIRYTDIKGRVLVASLGEIEAIEGAPINKGKTYKNAAEKLATEQPQTYNALRDEDQIKLHGLQPDEFELT